MLSKLLLILFSVSIQGEDWCKLVKPGGTYKGLGIFHYFELRGSHPDDYRMYNRDDAQWIVEVKVSGGDITLRNIENSSIPVSERNVINKFSTLIVNADYAGECNITEEREIKAECRSMNRKNFDKFSKIEPKFKNSVIVKIYPSISVDPFADYWLVFSKINRGDYFFFKTAAGKQNCSEKECLFVPQFINEMDSSLFKQIESVADININGTTGYLLLFTIDDKPKYCFTPENQTLSEECKTADNMKPLFEECFLTKEPVTELKTESTSIGSTDEPSSGIVWVIIVIVVVILLIVAVIVVGFIFLQQKTAKEKPADQKTSGASPPRSGSMAKAGVQSNELPETSVRSNIPN